MNNYKAIVRSFYEGIWNKYDKPKILALLHEDFSFRGSLGQVHHGLAGFASYVDFVRVALGVLGDVHGLTQQLAVNAPNNNNTEDHHQ